MARLRDRGKLDVENECRIRRNVGNVVSVAVGKVRWNHQYALAIAGALYTAVSIYYYFRIVKAMFVAEERDAQPLASTAGIYITAAVTGLVTLGFGIFPEPVLRFVTATAGAR